MDKRLSGLGRGMTKGGKENERESLSNNRNIWKQRRYRQVGTPVFYIDKLLNISPIEKVGPPSRQWVVEYNDYTSAEK